MSGRNRNAKRKNRFHKCILIVLTVVLLMGWSNISAFAQEEENTFVETEASDEENSGAVKENDEKDGGEDNGDPGNSDDGGIDMENSDSAGNEVENGDAAESEVENSDAAGSESGNGDTVGNEAENNDTVGSEPGNGDVVESEPGDGDVVGNEPGNSDAIGSESGNGDAIGSESGNGDAVGNEPGNGDTVGSEPGNNDAVGDEPENNDSVGNGTENNDTVGNEPGNDDTIDSDTENSGIDGDGEEQKNEDTISGNGDGWEEAKDIIPEAENGIELYTDMSSVFEFEGIKYTIINENEAEVSIQEKAISGVVKIPDSITYNGITYSVTSIGDGAFSDCKSMTGVEIPNSVTNIGIMAFLNCNNLSEIKIPDSVKNIGASAFAGCTGLNKVTIPDSIKNLPGVFYGCSRLSILQIVISGSTEAPQVIPNCFDGLPDDRTIVFLATDGSELTGEAFETAKIAYLGDKRDGDDSDKYWWGWKIKEPPKCKVTVTVRKDNAEWTNHNRRFALKKDNENSFIENLNEVEPGEYVLYDITDDKQVNTEISVKIVEGNIEITVDYYTVTFYDGDVAYEDGTPQEPQIILKGQKASPPNDPSKAGKQFACWKKEDDTEFVFNQEIVNGTTNIYASWEEVVKTYTITATAGAGGSISPSGDVQVNEGDSKSFKITPGEGYRIISVTVDGADVTTSLNGSTTGVDKYYVFENVTDNHTIHVDFELSEGNTPNNGDTSEGDKNPGGGENSEGDKNPGGGENSEGDKNPGGGENSEGDKNPGGGENSEGDKNPGGGENSEGDKNPGGGENSEGDKNPGGDNNSGSGNNTSGGNASSGGDNSGSNDTSNEDTSSDGNADTDSYGSNHFDSGNSDGINDWNIQAVVVSKTTPSQTEDNLNGNSPVSEKADDKTVPESVEPKTGDTPLAMIYEMVAVISGLMYLFFCFMDKRKI